MTGPSKYPVPPDSTYLEDLAHGTIYSHALGLTAEPNEFIFGQDTRVTRYHLNMATTIGF